MEGWINSRPQNIGKLIDGRGLGLEKEQGFEKSKTLIIGGDITQYSRVVIEGNVL